jgi:hypothetical protein
MLSVFYLVFKDQPERHAATERRVNFLGGDPANAPEPAYGLTLMWKFHTLREVTVGDTGR